MLTGSLLNMATGSLSIAMICLRSYWKEMSSIIIIACSSMLCGICQLMQLGLRYRLLKTLNTLITITILVTFGASVSHCYYLLHNFKIEELNIPLMRAHLGVLLATMLLGGMQLNIIMLEPVPKQNVTDVEKEAPTTYAKGDIKVCNQTRERFVSLKASAQTLTPELEIAIEKNWMNEYPTNYSGSDATSTPSVIKHKLPYQSVVDASNNTLKSKLKNSSFTAISPTSKKQVFEKIQRKFSIKSPTDKDKQSPSNPRTPESISYLETEIDAKYVTRLSTIPDVSKSYLNILKQTNEVNSARSVCLYDSDDIDGNLLKMEKDAINLYNSVLLPSILHNPKALEPTVNSSPPGNEVVEYNDMRDSAPSNQNEEESDDVLEQLLENDLQIQPEHAVYSTQNSVSQPALNTDIGNSTITIDYWNKNKDMLLNREKDHTQPADQLYPAFDIDTSFSFPLKKTTFPQGHEMYDGDDEVMSFVDRAIHPHETGLMEEGLKQNTSPIVPALYSHIEHSPTKSISSIVTAIRTPIKFNSGAFSTQDGRDGSQISLYLSNNNSRQLSSVQSSPTRLKKRLSQRLSRTNLRNDEESHGNMHFHSKSLTLTSFHQHQHSNSNSVNNIDLSYVHSLQQKHSPQKSISTLNARRRSSIYQPVNDFRVSTTNLPKADCPIDDLQAPSDLESFDIKEEDGNFGSSLSFHAETEYSGMDTGLSEYDREKLSILLNRQQIHNK